MKIGIDIGNVIIGGGGEDTSFFSDQFLKTPEVDGAMDSMFFLHGRMQELHIISKCGESVEKKSLLWLNYHSVFRFVPWHRVHFVRKRHLKAPMAQALELEVFIDDRQDVLDHMEGIVPHLILFASWEQTNTELEKIFAAQG